MPIRRAGKALRNPAKNGGRLAERVLRYGPDKVTELRFHATDLRGTRYEILFTEDALRQLASVLRRIAERFPGAPDGH